MAPKQSITESEWCDNAGNPKYDPYCSKYSEWSFPDRPGEIYCYYCACDIAEHGDIMLKKVSQETKE